MNVIVACEFSGIVRDAFLRRGHYAVSIDILPTESPRGDRELVHTGSGADSTEGYTHIQMDVHEYFDSMVSEGRRVDLIIMHPPCTHLAVSGNRWYGRGTQGYPLRKAALQWTKSLWGKALIISDMVAMENPVGVLSGLPGLPRPQYIQPWQFGHGETKKTGLWLHNLPELRPADVVDGREPRIHRMSPGDERGKLRSISYFGIAEAMADQWAGCATRLV